MALTDAVKSAPVYSCSNCVTSWPDSEPTENWVLVMWDVEPHRQLNLPDNAPSLSTLPCAKI